MTFAVENLSFALPCILQTQTYRVHIGVTGIMEKEMETVRVTLWVYCGNIRVILGLDWDSGKKKENGSYHNGLYEPSSKLLVSHLITPTVLPYIMPYAIPGINPL